MSKYNITHDDGSGRPMRTYTSKNGKYTIRTNNPNAIKHAGGALVVGDNSKITVNHHNPTNQPVNRPGNVSSNDTGMKKTNVVRGGHMKNLRGMITRADMNQHTILPRSFRGRAVYTPAWRRGPWEEWRYYSKGKAGIIHFDTYVQAAAYFTRRGISNFR